MSVPATNLEPRELVVRNPATGEEIGRLHIASPREVADAVGQARKAQSAWAAMKVSERGRIVLRARDLVVAELDEIATLISSEMGKPIAEALSSDLAPSLDLMQYFARRTARLLRPEKLNIGQYGLMGRSSRIVYRPLGVVGIISPWNFPWSIPMGEVVMALMAGNTVVLKPSELTPFTALRIADVFRRAGLPDGVLRVLTGDGSTGAALAESCVDKIMFTGSVATGVRVAESAAKNLTPVVLELGGKCPMIVLDDANLETAASAAVWGAFSNSGQACASVERCYVDERIAPQFIAAVVEKTGALRQGIGTSEATDVGSMSSERQLGIVEAHVDDATALGAKILIGGKRSSVLKGPFFEPTVVVGVDHTMRVMREETFGPVLPIMTFRTEEEVIRLANDCVFGLTASVFTSDVARGRRVAELIEAGTVMVNEVIYTHGIGQTPWGGMKKSGLGRTHGRLGLLELVTPQHIHVNRLGFVGDIWWFNYTPNALKLFRDLARRISTGSLFQIALLGPQMVRRILERRRSAGE